MVWDRSCRAHTVLDSIPSIASIIPKMRMMRGSGGTIPLGGGGGYVAQGLVHIYIYIHIIYVLSMIFFFFGVGSLCQSRNTQSIVQHLCRA